MRRRLSHGATFVALTTMIVASLTTSPVQAATGEDPPPTGPTQPTQPTQVQTAIDAVLAKIDPKLQTRVKKGETAPVAVFATVQGDTAQAREVLDNARVANPATPASCWARFRCRPCRSWPPYQG